MIFFYFNLLESIYFNQRIIIYIFTELYFYLNGLDKDKDKDEVRGKTKIRPEGRHRWGQREDKNEVRGKTKMRSEGRQRWGQREDKDEVRG